MLTKCLEENTCNQRHNETPTYCIKVVFKS